MRCRPGRDRCVFMSAAVVTEGVSMSPNTQAKSPETTSAPAKMPQVKGGAVPYLTVNGAVKAADFYKKAFSADVNGVHPQDVKGRTMHAHVYINGGSVMMSVANHDHGPLMKDPAVLNVTLPVKDVDAWF